VTIGSTERGANLMRGTSRRGPGRAVSIATTILLGAALTLSACSQGANDKASRAGNGAMTTAGDNTGGATAKSASLKRQPLTTPQQIIYTADLSVRVAKIDPASTRAVSIATADGGYLFSQDSNLSDRADATLVFKVPPEHFSTVLRRLSELGTPLQKTISTTDVTDQVVDLEGRLATATASTTRLRALLANAANVPDIVAVERELTTRESEVETLQGQLRVVKSRVQLATITLVLTTTAPTKKTAIPGFTKALSGGWSAFANTGRVALAAVGATLPFLVLAAIAALIALALRRRRSAPLQTP
jgi:hypothetical protein